ncbi:hydroxyphenylacetyl-CoA thioesterase PaaI [Kineosporia rhizophila]|uniref:hydroxyphenylacetyl-CoA thioesterase PaaI n=1 Tax=Kineosporia TaxID=49184 RepID=UPI001E5C3020|nr:MULTISPECIES: hydroxyphenylacetyl-CoA thioesterase PaaI [Kineosporia]MCE0535130.1 hydroxyphenylacetyl-CoA thioesterase PaaI [Kineosporia rhizophila]GLY14583.1 phenylacetic acid degradation protein PaaD [Kineosporia sp. NBRC 101677]
MPATTEAQEIAERSARIMLGGDLASAALGMRLEHVAPGRAIVSMPVRADMTNGFQLCHGGLVAAVADTAFAVACNSYGEVTVAAGFDITLLESARLGDRLAAHAEERARRGRSGLYDVSVVRESDQAVIAEFRGRSRSLGRPIG